MVDVNAISTKTRSVTAKSKHYTKWMDKKRFQIGDYTRAHGTDVLLLESIHLNTQV